MDVLSNTQHPCLFSFLFLPLFLLILSFLFQISHSRIYVFTSGYGMGHHRLGRSRRFFFSFWEYGPAQWLVVSFFALLFFWFCFLNSILFAYVLFLDTYELRPSLHAEQMVAVWYLHAFEIIYIDREHFCFHLLPQGFANHSLLLLYSNVKWSKKVCVLCQLDGLPYLSYSPFLSNAENGIP